MFRFSVNSDRSLITLFSFLAFRGRSGYAIVALHQLVVQLLKSELPSKQPWAPVEGRSGYCADVTDYIPFAVAQSIYLPQYVS
jgi:hypothetical protein